MTANGFLMAGGFAFATSEVVSDHFMYDVENNYWRRLWIENEPGKRTFGHSLISVQDKVLLTIGGARGFVGEVW